MSDTTFAEYRRLAKKHRPDIAQKFGLPPEASFGGIVDHLAAKHLQQSVRELERRDVSLYDFIRFIGDADRFRKKCRRLAVMEVRTMGERFVEQERAAPASAARPAARAPMPRGETLGR